VTPLADARARTLALVSDLPDWLGPRLAIVNPILWEIGHVAWFCERWVHDEHRLDDLYDSARVAHDTRWDLPLPDRAATLAYMADVLARCEHREGYFHDLALFHEYMHAEALTYTRQTLGYPDPFEDKPIDAGPLPGDVEVPGCTYWLGAREHDGFVFDNEKWAHPVEVSTFRIARAPVTNADYAKFVDAGGPVPVYWERVDRAWHVRRYDRVVPLPPHQPIIHVSWDDAQAYCVWANRRLPTEAEWELAASTPAKRRYPWGDDLRDCANLDSRHGGPVDVAAYPDGDSAYGCRQMFGNVWEWTSTRFLPYPGFVVDPYKEYSEPWFHTPHMVLRGGCWATRAGLLRTTWRNFYAPHRSDVLAGFRTCAT
jgi:gamma-glutamyl hercynylcysteine S-oxide synthase